MNFNKNVTDYISHAQEEQIEVLEVLRKLIHESVSGVTEDIKWGFPVFSKTKDFAYFRFSKHHITLGFYNIDRIIDSDNLLEGNGNTLKHIKIKNRGDFDKNTIKNWLISIAE